jgi:phosphoglycolate phosphatase
MTDLPRPRAVLLDWDNTLAENWLSIQAALNAALADAGKPPMDLDSVMLQARHSARDVFPQLFGEDYRRARDVFYGHFNRNHLAGLRMMAGADELLDALAEAGVPLALVSNKKSDFLRREVTHLGWDGRFGAIVGAGDAQNDKPDPAPIYLALNGLKLTPGADIWMVGDTDVDIRAGKAAGCTSILIGSAIDPTLFEGAEPALRCRNCYDLAGFVRSERHTIS